MYSDTEIRHFLEFSMRFLSFTKTHFRKENELRAGSLAFHALINLQILSRQELTMSELAQEMMITKQQLTRLVNDLENQGFVERIHNPVNRRQVYIHITPEGIAMLDEVKKAMAEHAAAAMAVFDDGEKAEIDACLTRLTELFSKLEGFGGSHVFPLI